MMHKMYLSFLNHAWKIMKKLSLFGILVLTGAVLSAQTAEDVISKYLDAIGGKKQISKIKSLYVEGTMEVEGMEGITKTTTLSGKGILLEVDMMGSMIVNCITDEGGWTINPFMGSSAPEDIPEEQYNSAKYQIVIGGPFINYKENGFKAELAGEGTVGDVKAVKVKLTSPEGIESEHFFNTESGYLIRSIEDGDMGENISTFSDYKEVDGMFTPFSSEISAAGGQAYIYMTVEKVEMNRPVDESIFNRPE
jgi:hypothetical protein